MASLSSLSTATKLLTVLFANCAGLAMSQYCGKTPRFSRACRACSTTHADPPTLNFVAESSASLRLRSKIFLSTTPTALRSCDHRSTWQHYCDYINVDLGLRRAHYYCAGSHGQNLVCYVIYGLTAFASYKFKLHLGLAHHASITARVGYNEHPTAVRGFRTAGQRLSAFYIIMDYHGS